MGLPDNNDTTMAGIVERNIEALVERRREEEQAKDLQSRIADSITRFTGNMRFVYLHLAVFGFWIITNLGWIPRIRPFDPSFVMLAMVASVEAIFLSTFVLISQNRMQNLADRRAELGLHVSLLAEHEITRIMTLVKGIAERMGVEESKNPELDELSRDVAPEQVLDRMDEAEQRREK